MEYLRRYRSGYSALMLAARITLAHLSVSSAMNLPKPAGDSAKHRATEVGDPRLQLRVGKARIDLVIEFVDEFVRRALWCTRVWTNPVDALVHCIFDFHGRPPLLKFAYQPGFPSPFDYTTDRFLWHGPQHHRTQEFSYPASPSDSAMSRNASERQLSVKS
jgi:hypothetical protein